MYQYDNKIRWNVFLFLWMCSVFYPARAQEPDSLRKFVYDDLQNASVPGDLFGLRKNNSTASVATVNGEVLQQTPVANLHNTMYGLFPGMHVAQGSGEPGYDGAWLTIRGIGSYNFGSYAIYVDGFQTNSSFLQYLAPAEIESISILKDAAALATFGMKGANGVVWVETKRGKVGKPQVKLRLRTGLQQPIHLTKPLGSYEYASLYNEAFSNDNGRIWTPRYTDAQLNDYKSGKGIDTDWYDEVLKASTPFLSTDASFSGGMDAARYFVMVNFTRSQGLYNTKTDDTHSNARLQQFNIRSNFDFKLFDIFEGKVDLGGRIEDRRYPGYAGDRLWENLERYPHIIYPVRNENGSWTGTAIYPDNPLASITDLGYFSTRDRNLQVNFSLKEKLDFLLPGLYLTEAVSFNNWTRGGYDVTKNYARFIGEVPQTTDKNTNYSIHDDWGKNQWSWIQLKASAGYDKRVGQHQITSAVSYLQYVYQVDADQNGEAGTNMKYAYRNMNGKVNYSYKDTYIGEFGFAVSGSDNYRKGNRYGFYPSVSVAWIVSNEAFFREKEQLNLLKVRASVGKSAYDGFNGKRYLYEQYYQWSGSYPTGNGTPSWHGGLVPAYRANRDIFAEEAMKYNIGMDVRLLDRLTMTADVFLDKRSGIVSQDFSMSDVYGMDAPYKNIGKVTTSGMEASLLYSADVQSFRYAIGGNVSYFKDKIDYMAELTPASPYAWKTGNSIGSQFGYEALGFYDIADFNADGTLKNNVPVPTFGEVQPGDIRYKDLNGDKRIDERDLLKIGRSDCPALIYAITVEAAYKNFDIRTLFQGAALREVNILDKAWNKVIAFENNGNIYEIAKGRWAYYPEKDIDTRASATYPRLSTLNNNNNYRSSSFWIKNGNFLRLRNVEVGYNLPTAVLKKFHLTRARLFVNGINLVTWSPLLKKYDMDPESLAGYPALKSYNFGITIDF